MRKAWMSRANVVAPGSGGAIRPAGLAPEVSQRTVVHHSVSPGFHSHSRGAHGSGGSVHAGVRPAQALQSVWRPLTLEPRKALAWPSLLPQSPGLGDWLMISCAGWSFAGLL